MTTRAIRSAVALLTMLLIASCADRPPADGGDTGAPPTTPQLPDGLVLQVEYTGGFVTPEMLASRLPLVSIYADGRVFSQGPVPAIYPGPALPNVQVARIDEAAVQRLVEQALAAGVAEDGDLGAPPIADAPSTRFTLVTDEATYVREVYALAEGAGGEDQLSPEQREGRAALLDLLDALTAATGGASEAYVPDALAVIARPWTAADDEIEPDLRQPEVAWPGPALPGEPLEPALGLSCLLVTGTATAAVLEAASTANARTPWVAADGSRWALSFRPLLPHESDCTALRS